MHIVTRMFGAGLLVTMLTLSLPEDLQAQYPVIVQPVAPTVIGYTAERRGLFGQRTAFRPVIAPAVSTVPVVPMAQPVVSVARPVVGLATPPVTVARPVVPIAPQAVAAPVAAYYAPAAPVVVPTRAYRIPVRPFYPPLGL